ncbi:carbonic anhydrase [Thermoflexales bacterium]|nr:carbonic anhydrase [Thermoflexales bacterium]
MPHATAANPFTAEQALQRLLEGNQRYATEQAEHPHVSMGRRAEVAAGQQPFAIILCCSDSRVGPELIFDQGLGDLFVVRTAGHVIDDAVMGSLEYACEELSVPLVMVLGHSRCGAVHATFESVEKFQPAPDLIRTIVEEVRPAVEKVRGQSGDHIELAVRAHVELTVNRIRKLPYLANMLLEKGRPKVVGARYDIVTGWVEVTVP